VYPEIDGHNNVRDGYRYETFGGLLYGYMYARMLNGGFWCSYVIGTLVQWLGD